MQSFWYWAFNVSNCALSSTSWSCLLLHPARVRATKATTITMALRMLVSLERLSYTMVFIGWQQHVLRKINFHAMSLPDGDRGRDLNEPVENRRSRLRHAGRCAVRKRLWA